MAAAADRPPRAIRAAGCRRRHPGQRDDRRSGTGGGESVPAPRPSRAVAAGAAAVAVALATTAWLAIAAGDDAALPVAALGVLGSLLTAAAVVAPAATAPALGAIGAAYAALLLIDEPPLDTRAAGVAAALVVVGETLGWARELAGRARDEPGNAWRRPGWIAAAGIGTLGLAWALLAVADLARVQGLAIEAAGALAALAVVLAAPRLARSTDPS